LKRRTELKISEVATELKISEVADCYLSHVTKSQFWES